MAKVALAGLLPLLLLVSAFMPVASGQLPVDNRVLYQVRLDVPEGTVRLPAGQATFLTLQLADLSRDSTGGLAQGTPANVAAFQHVTNVVVEKVPIDAGVDPDPNKDWILNPPAVIYSRGGETVDIPIQVVLAPTPATPQIVVRINTTTVMGTGDKLNSTAQITLLSTGISSFSLLSGRLVTLAPRQIQSADFRIQNLLLEPRIYDVTVDRNDCGLSVGPPATIQLPRHHAGDLFTTVTFNVAGPEDQFWYRSEACNVQLRITPRDLSGLPQRSESKLATVTITVNGFNFNPDWVWSFLTVWLPLLLLVSLVVIFLRRRKERIQEEILGRPQKPWLIPVEAVYLKRLRETDPRAYTLVRHHLMEDEYRSAMLWYKAYKAATRGTREKEAVMLRQERQYDKWRAAQEKAIGRPLVEADRYEAKLQRKLDRKARKAFRRERRHVRKLNKSLSRAHAAKLGKALEKWEKAAAKAQKKGRPVPARPSLEAPVPVAEPEAPAPRPLAEHRWARKAARFRKRCIRRVGDLEVKFERADARRLAKIRRKAARLARKLDDPDFMAEHPLLSGRSGDSRSQ